MRGSFASLKDDSEETDNGKCRCKCNNNSNSRFLAGMTNKKNKSKRSYCSW